MRLQQYGPRTDPDKHKLGKRGRSLLEEWLVKAAGMNEQIKPFRDGVELNGAYNQAEQTEEN